MLIVQAVILQDIQAHQQIVIPAINKIIKMQMIQTMLHPNFRLIALYATLLPDGEMQILITTQLSFH